MKINVAISKEVAIALHAHGISSRDIAKYFMQDVEVQVELAVQDIVSQGEMPVKK